MTSESILIEDFGPLPVHRPATIAEASTLISSHAAVYPIGGRTALSIGLPPTQPGIALDTRSLNQLIDFPHRDMTVTAQAGMTVAQLQSILAKEGQTLPIDLPFPEQATLGGAIAVNSSGPRRLSHGTLRDYLIGISFLSDTGEEVKAGGRVVKNVAGYDLMKLHLGALGQFGIVTQVTFKVKPVAEAMAIVRFGVESNQLVSTLDQLHASASRPIAVELLNRAAADALGLECVSPWLVVCVFEEKAMTVDWQLQALASEFKRDMTTERGPAVSARIQALTEFPCRAQSEWVWRMAVKPSEVAGLVIQSTGLIHAHALNGIVWIHGDRQRPHAMAVARHAPITSKSREIVWGPPRSDSKLRTTIREKLDPQSRFNPGRV